MPALEALHRQQGSEGVQVVTVNLQEAPEVVAGYLAARGLALPVLLDSAGSWPVNLT